MNAYRRGWMLGALGCLAVTAAWAQETPRDEGPAADRAAAKDARQADAAFDAFVRHCLALANENEIELAQFAQQKSRSPAVQQFTKRMIEDHGRLRHEVNGEPRPADAPRDAARELAGRETRIDHAGQLPAPYQKLARIDDQIAQKCLQSAKQELGSKQGAEFDKCYFGMQVFLHRGMADKLQVLQQYASPELAQTLQEGLKISQEHAQLAEQMLQQAEVAATARKPADARQQ